MCILLQWFHMYFFIFFCLYQLLSGLVRRCQCIKYLIWSLLARMFWLKDWFWHLLMLYFHWFLFNTIIYFRSSFTVFFILFTFMFFSQVPHTTISFTWRLIVTMHLLISIINVIFLILKWWSFFCIMFFFIRYSIFVCPFTWVVWFLNTFFSFNCVRVFLLLLLQGIRYLSENSLITLAPCPGIP